MVKHWMKLIINSTSLIDIHFYLSIHMFLRWIAKYYSSLTLIMHTRVLFFFLLFCSVLFLFSISFHCSFHSPDDVRKILTKARENLLWSSNKINTTYFVAVICFLYRYSSSTTLTTNLILHFTFNVIMCCKKLLKAEKALAIIFSSFWLVCKGA